MEGMIFAAGLGSRLGAMAQRVPKALVDVGGRTMLERTIQHLVHAGVDHVIVNVHHLGDAIAHFIAAHTLGVEIDISWERGRALDTGGGLWHARRFFRRGTFLLHNVDIVSDAPLKAIAAEHEVSGALVTLLVEERESCRRLLFDELGLFGREDRCHGLRVQCREQRGEARAFAFAGIHVCSEALFEHITERGVFSIRDTYMRLASEGHKIQCRPLVGNVWFDIGSPAQLEAARDAARGGRLL